MDIKHEYIGRMLVVTLPNGNKINVNDLIKDCGLKHAAAHRRLKRYIKTGNLKNLLKPSQQSIKESKLSETHYEAGDIRMYKDEEWIRIMKALTNKA